MVSQDTLKLIFRQNFQPYGCLLEACLPDLDGQGVNAYEKLICCVMRNILEPRHIEFYHDKTGAGTTSYRDWRAAALGSGNKLLIDLIHNGDPNNNNTLCTSALLQIYRDVEEWDCEFFCESCPAV